jgi:hypothetical protein
MGRKYERMEEGVCGWGIQHRALASPIYHMPAGAFYLINLLHQKDKYYASHDMIKFA